MEKLMEGGIIAAPCRLRYYPAPAWARMVMGHGPHARTSFALVETAGVGWHLPSIKASRRWGTVLRVFGGGGGFFICGRL